jgi:hypothetical protein
MTKKINNPGSSLCIFLGTDRQLFEQLKKEVKALWFHKYGENLVMSRLLIMALKALKESIEKDTTKIGE